MEDAHPSLDGSVKKPSKPSPAAGEEIAQELDLFNLRYQKLSETLRTRLRTIGEGEETKNDPDVKVGVLFVLKCFFYFIFFKVRGDVFFYVHLCIPDAF